MMSATRRLVDVASAPDHAIGSGIPGGVDPSRWSLWNFGRQAAQAVSTATPARFAGSGNLGSPPAARAASDRSRHSSPSQATQALGGNPQGQPHLLFDI